MSLLLLLLSVTFFHFTERYNYWYFQEIKNFQNLWKAKIKFEIIKQMNTNVFLSRRKMITLDKKNDFSIKKKSQNNQCKKKLTLRNLGVNEFSNWTKKFSDNS